MDVAGVLTTLSRCSVPGPCCLWVEGTELFCAVPVICGSLAFVLEICNLERTSVPALPLWAAAGCGGNATGLMFAPALLGASLGLLDKCSGTLLSHFSPPAGVCCSLSLFSLSPPQYIEVFGFFCLGKAALGG